jgi:hypothetical protein
MEIQHESSHFSLRRMPQSAAIGLAALAGQAVMAQTVALDTNCIPQLTRQQERLYQKANDGTDALRQFIFIRRAVLQVDIYETAAWAESIGQARAACVRARAAAARVQAAGG